MICRMCGSLVERVVIDLGEQPPSNALLSPDRLNNTELVYPLIILICDSCYLVQTSDAVNCSEIFNQSYPYFSSVSRTWLAHAKSFAEFISDRFLSDQNSNVIEVASNDGYLLQYFLEKRYKVLGIEPSEPPAAVARQRGIETISDFMSEKFAKDFFRTREKADLLIANNVLAHVPDLNDFIIGISESIKPQGIISVEFPSVVNLVKLNQFDTFYHEHFSYFCFTTAYNAFQRNGLQVFDVEDIPTHGGSLRLLVQRVDTGKQSINQKVDRRLQEEADLGIMDVNFYSQVSVNADICRNELLNFLNDASSRSKIVAAYGAAAKGNTLLNYCRLSSQQISYVADASRFKQGKYLPGSHIEIVEPERLKNINPDYILILPWNIRSEIEEILRGNLDLKSRLVVAIPKLEIF